MATRTVAKELKKKTPKKLKDVNAPKAPLSAYFRFGQEQRKKDPSVQALTVGQQGKMLSEMWKQISEADKEVYRIEYMKEKEKYQVELEAYKKTDDYKNWLKQKEALALDVKGGKKKKRSSQSGYNVYFKEQYPILAASGEGDDKPQMKDVAAMIAKQWKLISEEEKAPYKEKADEYNKKVIDSENASKDESEEEEEEIDESDEE